MRRKIFALLLALSLCLTACGTAVPEPERLPEGENTGPEVSYIPLDDRPVNADRVVYLAESLGYRLTMPEEGLYRTRLDGQDSNPNGTAYGDRAGLYAWLQDREAAGCDRYILSLDQLLSGGLVNSRSFPGADVTLQDGTVLTEEAFLAAILDLLADGENEVYLLDTVMRLAPTVGYDGWDLAGYEALRSYGMAARPTLSGDALTVENITAAYSLGADGAPLDPADYGVTEEEVAQYLRCRERKLRLIDEALRRTEGRENVHFLIGVDDSAPTDSVQTNELAYLRQAVAGRGAVLSGADEDGMLALCRMFAVSDYEGELPTVTARYFGGSESGASSDYDHQPMTEIVENHLRYLGCEAGEDGDLQLLVLTAPAEESQRKTAIRDLIAALRQARKDGTPTILMDAAKNGYGTDFQRELVKKTELGFLLGYAGFYDLANATGIALANGVARWLCLQSGAERTQGQEDAFRLTLADSLVKDICYKNQAKIQTTVYVRDTLQGDPDNFCRTGTAEADVLPQAEADLREAAEDVLQNLSRSAMRTDAAGTLGGFGSLTIGKVSFPWLRVFEIRMEWEVSR